MVRHNAHGVHIRSGTILILFLSTVFKIAYHPDQYTKFPCQYTVTSSSVFFYEILLNRSKSIIIGFSNSFTVSVYENLIFV
jgi:hypothetical protein